MERFRPRAARHCANGKAFGSRPAQRTPPRSPARFARARRAQLARPAALRGFHCPTWAAVGAGAAGLLRNRGSVSGAFRAHCEAFHLARAPSALTRAPTTHAPILPLSARAVATRHGAAECTRRGHERECEGKGEGTRRTEREGQGGERETGALTNPSPSFLHAACQNCYD